MRKRERERETYVDGKERASEDARRERLYPRARDVGRESFSRRPAPRDDARLRRCSVAAGAPSRGAATAQLSNPVKRAMWHVM